MNKKGKGSDVVIPVCSGSYLALKAKMSPCTQNRHFILAMRESQRFQFSLIWILFSLEALSVF